MAGCTTQELQGAFDRAFGATPLSTDEVARGLKEALITGIGKGADSASRTDGYLKNALIAIAFPEDARRAEEALRKIGLGSQVDRFVVALNRGAEEAAAGAKPIFMDAIRSMTIQDAWGILNGPENAATDYLRRTTYKSLYTAFEPVVARSLDNVSATRYYGEIVSRYNRIPLVEPVNPDLNDYATTKAIDGLFTLVAQEERNIRENPVARTTELLRKVFAAQGQTPPR